MDKMEKIVSLCKRRGFIVPSLEIYGGQASTYDYGPLAVELKNNIKKIWWQDLVWRRDDIIGLDSAIIMGPKVFEASGHLKGFTDLLVECRKCHKRFKEEGTKGECPECGGDLTEPAKFNLMLETYLGPVKDKASISYLRPETAQGIFVNFKYLAEAMRMKLPFGIAQIGKAFRNEITPSNFTFRTREFEQMEMEWFCQKEEAKKWFDFWAKQRFDWYIKLGIKKENLRLRKHTEQELAHYAIACNDVEYKFPWGWSELEGIANRGNYDLRQHSKFSGKDLSFQRIIPYVIEPSGGVDRACLAFLIDAYDEGKDRVVLKLDSKLAPYKVAVFPLLANKPKLVKKAREVYEILKGKFMTAWDARGNIGKRYYSQDEIGTPFCLTIDFKTQENDTVTIRDRDTMKQKRVKIKDLVEVIKEKLEK